MVKATVIEIRRLSAHGEPVVRDRPAPGHPADVRLVRPRAEPRIQGDQP